MHGPAMDGGAAVWGVGRTDALLRPDEITEICAQGVAAAGLAGQRVLMVVPDLTRTCPLGAVFRAVHDQLEGVVAQLDVIVALGTHPPLSPAQIDQRVGITAEERATRYAGVRFFNHDWRAPGELVEVGSIAADEIAALCDGRFAIDVPVTCNRRVHDYDHLLLVGPVFPHEVAGFSGGNKYVAPGIAGPQIIDFFHWLGAVITSPAIIGHKWTPVRKVIDRSASMLPLARSALCMVVRDGELAGLYCGAPEDAWSAAADLSAQLHVTWVEKPFHTVVSCAPAMYRDLWVAGKCMYKLEPVVADGGRLVIYAPHVREISPVHGAVLEEIGYHVRDYFLAQWERFASYPWGVLAHSTHVRGAGRYENGVETARVEVALATGIPEAMCRRVGLGYVDPAGFDPADYAGRESEGVLCVPRAGEQLFRCAAPGA